MKKVLLIIVAFALMSGSVLGMIGCGKKTDLIIYSSMEDFRNDKLEQMLKEKFTDLKIDIQYLPSGNNAAKIKAEGTSIEADIIMDIDYGYLESLKNNFADLSFVTDITKFEDDLVGEGNKYLPLAKFSIGIIVNVAALNGAAVPASYDNLIKAEYKGKISMPNPKASGTGYGFLKGMVALKGETEAFAYFEELQKNISQFTSSGSGPVNNLVRGESGVGIGMIFQAVQEIAKGADLKILDLAGGTPYNLSGLAVIKGREEKQSVKDVFNYIATEFLKYDKTHFMPEKIFKDQPETSIKDYPVINNMDMKGFDSAEKERLLAKWNY